MTEGPEEKLIAARIRQWRRARERRRLHEDSDAIWDDPAGDPHDVDWHSWGRSYVDETAGLMLELAREVVKMSVECYQAFGEAEAASTLKRCQRELADVRALAAGMVSRRFTDARVAWRYAEAREIDCWLDRLKNAEAEVTEEAKDMVEEQKLQTSVADAALRKVEVATVSDNLLERVLVMMKDSARPMTQSKLEEAIRRGLKMTMLIMSELLELGLITGTGGSASSGYELSALARDLMSAHAVRQAIRIAESKRLEALETKAGEIPYEECVAFFEKGHLRLAPTLPNRWDFGIAEARVFFSQFAREPAQSPDKESIDQNVEEVVKALSIFIEYVVDDARADGFPIRAAAFFRTIHLATLSTGLPYLGVAYSNVRALRGETDWRFFCPFVPDEFREAPPSTVMDHFVKFLKEFTHTPNWRWFTLPWNMHLALWNRPDETGTYKLKREGCSKAIAVVLSAAEYREPAATDHPAHRHEAEPCRHRPMKDIAKELRTIAPGDCTILLTGEPGTGKNHWASRIHKLSRCSGEFVPVLCPAIPQDLFENELFGHKKGAFTGADDSKEGFVEAAVDGTLFLDEIAELPPHVQAKLLHLLEQRTFRRVGETEEREAQCRIIVATNRDLRQLVSSGAFREDLLARISTFAFRLPPLRERRDEIPELLKALQEEFSPTRHRRISAADCRKLRDADHDWPGNIRTLRAAVERMFMLSSERYVSAASILDEAKKLASAGSAG